MLALLVQYARIIHSAAVGPVSLSFSLLIEHFFGHVLIENIVAFLMTNSIFFPHFLLSLS